MTFPRSSKTAARRFRWAISASTKPSTRCSATSTCATARRYAYVLLQSPVRPSVESGRVGWVFHPLDGDAMRAAAQHLLGEHDFTSFRASACQAKTPIKTLHRIDITRRGEDAHCYWRFEFEGNTFLHHMVRNIMGCLLEIGQGMHEIDHIDEIFAAEDRKAAGVTAPPDGLYFIQAHYPEHFDLPKVPLGPHWLNMPE